jgi:cyclophilin family peptidyl-prolyl cis-trans isomerase/HEAT repeat protein
MRPPLVLLAACLAGCGSPEVEPQPLLQSPPVLPGSKGASIELRVGREFEEIARLEDARSLGGGRLIELLAQAEDPGARARAALALGRMPYPRFGTEVTEALARALEDPELEVRLAVAFALGLRADPTSAGTLLAYRNDPEASLRARVVEAASKIDDAGIRPQLLLALRDADLGVRMEAAVGAARWDSTAPDASDVDRALLDALSPYRITAETAPKTAVEAELVWRILWALGRRKALLGRGPFLEYAGSEIALERIFALRGLGALPPDRETVQAAAAALIGPRASSDWRVAYEAVVALGKFRSADGLEALEAAVEHPSAHVRAGAMEALGSFQAGDPESERVLSLLQRGRLDLSASVRAAALRARSRLLDPRDALELLAREVRQDDPVLRVAVADAAGTLSEPGALTLLQRLCADPNLLVATRAVEALKKPLAHGRAGVREHLHALLGHADNGIRLAAVLALRAAPAASDAAPLVHACESSTGDIAAEVAFESLENLGAIGGETARACLERALLDPRPHVRRVAREVLSRSFGQAPEALAEPEPAAPSGEARTPLPGKDYPLYRFNPMVELVTSRGSMVFELFPAEAPIHVHSFLTLVEHGDYDGLTFHRVVPDFVVQGGDYRGDGNGARPWAGEALRAEFTPRKYTRGSLGMPRNADPDSGGSQFFVTHVPTPHLDGRYTIFGELRTGGDVLDQIEVGDRILSARVLR